ncbi:hypothetical protein N431DRAFT_517049 [Stipitochalara longipes BDJ]|nr:hypothetical protein N431DRAFT_517049 [Stipitochalara longipes BDJ]
MRYIHQLSPGATAGTPKKPKSAPAKLVVGHLMSKIGRPSRSRRTSILSLLLVVAIFCLLLGRQHKDDLQFAAATLGSYVPDRVTKVLAHHIEGYESTRWDDVVVSEDEGKGIAKKPNFHLLIPYNKPTANLCKTMLSAAILNYPPPTLISYRTVGSKNYMPDVVQNTYEFLLEKEAHDDDLILVVEEDTWFQLPAQVLISRFFRGMRDSINKLLEKYGTIKGINDTTSQSKYIQKVLLGAAKECSSEPNEPACAFVPDSPLPKDIYGDETDTHAGGKYNRPRYVASSMVMGYVSDLRPIYKRATEHLKLHDIGNQYSQDILSQVFGEQEMARQIYAASQERNSGWPSWLVLRQSKGSILPNITLPQDKNYEFGIGIGLDYHSSIFQVMNNSADDVRFITFNHPSIIASLSKLPASAFSKPISLPLTFSQCRHHTHNTLYPHPIPTQLSQILIQSLSLTKLPGTISSSPLM